MQIPEKAVKPLWFGALCVVTLGIWLGSEDSMSAANTAKWFANFGERHPGLHALFRKAFHAVEYAFFSGALGAGLSMENVSDLKSWKGIVTVAAAAMYSLVDKYHQSYFPSRSPSAQDFMTEMLGALAGLMPFLKTHFAHKDTESGNYTELPQDHQYHRGKDGAYGGPYAAEELSPLTQSV